MRLLQDCLLRSLRKLRAVHGWVYDCLPLPGFLLPTEYTKFVQEQAGKSSTHTTGHLTDRPAARHKHV